MSVGVLATLISVAAGWVLSETSQLFRARRGHKLAVGRALADLLEVRHYHQAIDAGFREVCRLAPSASSEELRKGMAWMESFIPADPALPSRYERAVTEISATDPVLAFRLRSKDQLPAFLSRFRALEIQGEGVVDVDRFFEILDKSGLAGLDEAILSLAWAHSVFTWIRVRRNMRQVQRLPAEFRQLLQEVEARVRVQ